MEREMGGGDERRFEGGGDAGVRIKGCMEEEEWRRNGRGEW